MAGVLTLQRLAFYLFFRSVRSFYTPASSRAPKLTAGADTCNIISHSVEFSGIFIFGHYACLFATGLERPHIPFLISFLFASVLDSSASTLIFAFYFLVFACAPLYLISDPRPHLLFRLTSTFSSFRQIPRDFNYFLTSHLVEPSKSVLFLSLQFPLFLWFFDLL